MDIKEANFIASSKISWFKEETSPMEMAPAVTLSFAFFLSLLPNWNLKVSQYIHPLYWMPRFKEQSHKDHQTNSLGRIEFWGPNLSRYEWGFVILFCFLNLFLVFIYLFFWLPNYKQYCFGVHYLSIVEIYSFRWFYNY